MNSPKQSDFILEMRRLFAAVEQADTEGSKLQALEDLADFLRLNSKGRTREWFDARRAQAGRDA